MLKAQKGRVRAGGKGHLCPYVHLQAPAFLDPAGEMMGHTVHFKLLFLAVDF